MPEKQSEVSSDGSLSSSAEDKDINSGGNQQATIDQILTEGVAPSQQSIFANRDLLDIDNIPTEDRIVGRDEYITELARNLHQLANGAQPQNRLHWGETGTGKTLVARHVCERTEHLSRTTDGFPEVAATYINASTSSSFTTTIQQIAAAVNQKLGGPMDVPSKGVSADYYQTNYLWPLVKDHFPGGLIVLLDEIDKHPDASEVLYTLSRADIERPVVTIGISNDINFKGEISARAMSSLQPEQKHYSPYDENQLKTILQNRRDAFIKSVLNGAVIPTVAELAAKEHGDARRAMNLLKTAGVVAENEQGDQVTVDHVQQAEERVEVELFTDTIAETGLDAKLLLFALTRLHQSNPREDWFRTRRIRQEYKQIARDIQTDVKSHNRTLQLLNQHVTTGVLASKKKQGGGGGTYCSYSIQGDVATAREALINATPPLTRLMGTQTE